MESNRNLKGVEFERGLQRNGATARVLTSVAATVATTMPAEPTEYPVGGAAVSNEKEIMTVFGRGIRRTVSPSAAFEHALDYAKRGWHVFPAPPGEKKSYKSAEYSGGRQWGATTDELEVHRDFGRWPSANVGIVTGPKSDIFVIECDTTEGHDVDGIASLEALEAEYGVLPETLMAASPSGSIHRYFNYPANVTIKNSASDIGPGVDVRGDGGMVIAPPSVKHGKGTYKWLNNNPIADAPDWLIALCEEKPKQQQSPRTDGGNYPPAELAEIVAALAVIPSDKETVWYEIGCALAKELGDDGLSVFRKWSARSNKFDAMQCEQKWEHCKTNNGYNVGTVFHYANDASPEWRTKFREQCAHATFSKQTQKAEAGKERPSSGVTLGDFVANLPEHNYVFLPTRAPWPASSVDSQLPPMPKLDKNGKQVLIPAHTWLDKYAPVQQMAWCPGLPLLIPDKLVADGGWIDRPGVTTLNLYRPPTIKLGNAAEAEQWVDLVKRVYPDHHLHLIHFFAQRVQQPQVKINHGIVMGGAPRIGKDTILEPVKRAIGHWNWAEVAPRDLMGQFNPHVKSVVLRVSEARDLGEMNRYTFYEHTKTLMAAPPDVLRCNEKNLREHAVFNVTGVIVTTNHLADGIYLPEDDGRHYVAWSPLMRESFDDGFWKGMYYWYEHGGFEHVAAYLAEYDLTGFDPKAPPPKTKAFWDIVNANRAPEEAELADIFDKMGNPDAVTLDDIKKTAKGDIYDWLCDRRNRRALPHRLERCGYVPVRNTHAKDGLWVIGGARQAVYAKAELSLADQLKAAAALVRPARAAPPGSVR